MEAPWSTAQLTHDLTRVRVAVRTILLQGAAHDAGELWRRRRRQPGRPFMHDRVANLGPRSAVERGGAGEHLVNHRAERKHIRACVGGFATYLLGRHVPGSSHHSAGDRLVSVLALEELGDSEVEDLQPPVVGKEQVFRLDVPVDDPLCVCR